MISLHTFRIEHISEFRTLESIQHEFKIIHTGSVDALRERHNGTTWILALSLVCQSQSSVERASLKTQHMSYFGIYNA